MLELRKNQGPKGKDCQKPCEHHQNQLKTPIDPILLVISFASYPIGKHPQYIPGLPNSASHPVSKSLSGLKFHLEIFPAGGRKRLKESIKS